MARRSTGAWALLLVGACLAAGCAGLKSHSDYDPAIDFTQYEAFAWAEQAQIVRSQQDDDSYISPLDLQRIRRAIESELVTKGFRQTTSAESADFLVSFTVGARERLSVDSYPVTYRNRWTRHWPYYVGVVDAHTYTEGMLAIDILDVRARQPAWHGVARKRITDADSANSGPLIKEAVAAILREFPP